MNDGIIGGKLNEILGKILRDVELDESSRSKSIADEGFEGFLGI